MEIKEARISMRKLKINNHASHALFFHLKLKRDDNIMSEDCNAWLVIFFAATFNNWGMVFTTSLPHLLKFCVIGLQVMIGSLNLVSLVVTTSLECYRLSFLIFKFFICEIYDSYNDLIPHRGCLTLLSSFKNVIQKADSMPESPPSSCSSLSSISNFTSSLKVETS